MGARRDAGCRGPGSHVSRHVTTGDGSRWPGSLDLSPPKDVHFSWSIGTSPFAVSPNGRQLVFTAIGPDNRRRLWLHSFDSLESRSIAGTEGAFGAFLSPDGREIGFFTADRLKRVSISGGDVTVICDAQFGGGATWNRDGVIVFAPRIDTPLYRVSAAGGTPTPLTTLDAGRGEGAHMKPLFLPDGRHFVFAVIGGEAPGTYVASLDSAERTRIAPEVVAVGFSAPDLLFFMRDRTLMVQRIDLERFTLLGQPMRVADGVDRLGPSAAFAVSDNATMVYWQGSRVITQPTWFQRNGTPAGTLGPAAAYMNVALSPDGAQAAADRFDLTPGIWLFHRARNTHTRETFGGVYESTPVWSPDGAAFVFAAARDTPPNLYVKRMGAPRRGRTSFPKSISDVSAELVARWPLHRLRHDPPEDAFGYLVVPHGWQSHAGAVLTNRVPGEKRSNLPGWEMDGVRIERVGERRRLRDSLPAGRRKMVGLSQWRIVSDMAPRRPRAVLPRPRRAVDGGADRCGRRVPAGRCGPPLQSVGGRWHLGPGHVLRRRARRALLDQRVRGTDVAASHRGTELAARCRASGAVVARASAPSSSEQPQERDNVPDVLLGQQDVRIGDRKPGIGSEHEDVLLQHLLESLCRVVVKVRRRVPDPVELRRLEHVGKEAGVQDAGLFWRQKLRQHRDVVHVGEHDPGIR